MTSEKSAFAFVILAILCGGPTLCAESSSLRIQVLNQADRTPIPGVDFRLNRVDPSYRGFVDRSEAGEVHSDNEGRCAIDSVPPGTYRLLAEKAGICPVSQEFEHRESTDTHLTFLMPEGITIGGTITDNRGNPATQVRLMHLQFYPFLLSRTGISDASGCFSIPNMPERVTRTRLSSPKYHSPSFDLRPNADNRIRLYPLVKHHIRVVLDDAGKAPEEVHVKPGVFHRSIDGQTFRPDWESEELNPCPWDPKTGTVEMSMQEPSRFPAYQIWADGYWQEEFLFPSYEEYPDSATFEIRLKPMEF